MCSENVRRTKKNIWSQNVGANIIIIRIRKKTERGNKSAGRKGGETQKIKWRYTKSKKWWRNKIQVRD